LKTKIEIREAAFYAYHGYYAEEQLIGSQFIVNAKVTLYNTDFADDLLTETVNYQTMYTIIKEEMNVPRSLIETLGQSIIERMMITFPAVVKASISLEKINPSIGGKLKSALVHLSMNRKEKQ